MATNERDEFECSEAEGRSQTTTLQLVPVAPGETRIEKLRAIVEAKAMMEVEGQIVDLFSANTVVQIHDALREPTNREKLLSFPLPRMFDIVFKLAIKCGNRGAS